MPRYRKKVCRECGRVYQRRYVRTSGTLGWCGPSCYMKDYQRRREGKVAGEPPDPVDDSAIQEPRVIEALADVPTLCPSLVVVASPPNREKQSKLICLKQRGLDVALVEVKSEQDLLNMVHLDSQAEFRRPANYVYKRNLASDVKVQELLGALTSCSPRLRRELALVLAQMGTLDSLHPLNQQNPLTDKLGE